MPARVTNLELFNRCDSAANEAADKLTGIGDDHRERHEPLKLEQITRVRNLLREALSCAQELKIRMKQRDAAPNERKTK